MEVIRLPLQLPNGQSTWSSTAPILAASCPVRRGHVTSPGQRIVNKAHMCHLQTKATANLFLGLQPQLPSRTVTTEVSHSKRGRQPRPVGPKRTRQKEFERVRPWPWREASAFQRTESILKPGTFSIPQRGGLRKHPLSEISEFPHTGEFRAPSVPNAPLIDAISILSYHDMWGVKDAHNLSF